MKTEIIAGWKLVVTAKGEKLVVTTVSGATVWATKAQFDTNAEQITYTPMKAGDKYTDKAGVAQALKADRLEFVGCGRQIIKKFTSLEILDHMASKGITPQFALS